MIEGKIVYGELTVRKDKQYGNEFHTLRTLFYRQNNLSDILAAVQNIVSRLCLGYRQNLVNRGLNLAAFNLWPYVADKACQNLRFDLRRF